MPVKPTTKFPWGILAGLVGGGFLLRVLLTDDSDDEVWSKEKNYINPNEKKATGKMQTLIAPLAPPLRKPTPHGGYGARRPTNTAKPEDHKHQGVDLSGKAGEKIFAVGDGIVVQSNPGKGEIVRVLLLDDGRAVVYADLGVALVEAGTRLKAGDVVATMRKNHFVHIAIRESRYGKFMNPAGIIPFDSGKPLNV